MYRTIDIARACDIHVNTVRFYERIGFLSPVPRDNHNCRVFSTRHLIQTKVIRLLYREEWPGRPIRRGAVEIIEAMKGWDLPEARAAVKRYLTVIRRETDNARQAVLLLRHWEADSAQSEAEFTISELAETLLVSKDMIRNWERNGLIRLPRRDPNNRRYATGRELDRLRIIAILRKSGHSIAIIHHALHRLRQVGLQEALETFQEPAGLDVLSAGDHYLEVLDATLKNGERVAGILQEAE